MIRKSNKEDVEKVVAIYDKILAIKTLREMTKWEKEIYPVTETADTAFDNGELFVMEIDSEIVSSAILNQIQMEEYTQAEWKYAAQDSEVMVLHTLVVDPDKMCKGYASKWMTFYESYAIENGCKFLRFDTSETNANARKLYKKSGCSEAGIIKCEFDGIGSVNLVCLEKKLEY